MARPFRVDMVKQGTGARPGRLERATTIAVLVAAMLLIGLASWRGLTMLGVLHPSADGPPPPAGTYAAGDVMDTLPGVDYSASPATFVLFVRSTCSVCTSSMDFYRRLALAPRRVPVVVAGAEPIEILERYLTDHDFAPDQLVQVQGGSVRVRGTPTAVLVDSGGQVQSVWLGRLDAAREANVLEAVR